MGKKIVLAVFGGIAVLGLLTSVAGWLLGGRVGNLNTVDGYLTYTAGGKTVQVSKAPAWIDRLGYYINHWDENRFGWNNYDYDYDYDYDSDYDNNLDENGEYNPRFAFNEEDFSQPTWWVSGEDVTTQGEERVENLPFTAAQLQYANIDIEAGYVVIQEGENPGLTVRGPMSYKSTFSDGDWDITSDVGRNISTRTENGVLRFYQGGRDITTVFIVTLSKNVQDVQGELDFGTMTVKPLETQNLNLHLALGAMQVQGGKAQDAVLAVELGDMRVNGLVAESCALDVELGKMDFVGTVNSSLSANCELGTLNAKLTKPANGYYAYAKADLGNITVDGQGVTMSEHSFGQEGGHSLEMDLNCGLGSMVVDFQ